MAPRAKTQAAKTGARGAAVAKSSAAKVTASKPRAARPSGGRTAAAKSAPTAASWTFLTNHAHVLICIADEPDLRLRDISARVGITERAAHRIVSELAEAGYITPQRTGRRNSYVIHPDRPLPDALARSRRVGDLIGILAKSRPIKPKRSRPAARSRKSNA